MTVSKETLIAEAKKARELAYVPYSKFPVGAALLSVDDEIFHGCNIENASFSMTNCAERTAFFKAVSSGITKFKAIAIVAATENAISPCGACRQVMMEFCDATMPVYLTNMNGIVQETTIGDLLPGAFTTEDLQNAGK